MLQKLKTLVIVIGFLAAPAVVAVPAASAITASDCASGKTVQQTTTDSSGKKVTQTVCAPLGGDNAGCKTTSDCLSQTPLTHDIQNIVNALAAGVGVVVVGSIIVGGIRYIVAGDNPNGVAAAKGQITNAIMALVAFFLTYAFLQWLIPGGIF